ncbi:MAG: CBS domain-containing protein [Rhodoplanes sp.]|uniref:CBS domain-containing protein n=1 Tax=Rhodoplanes sp. TaxID=1968906 RepID=UPI0017B57DB2|nr:CBS domain-containing protein [Rhodoplanes sp.]NVO17043.1 CBS domain-containing protein [Rhodoplanes sp.]
MTSPVVTVAPDSPIADAAQLMLDHRISGLPVVDRGGRLVGIVSERDLLRRRNGEGPLRRPHWLQLLSERSGLEGEPARFHTLTVGAVMTISPLTVTEATTIEDAGKLLEQHRIKRLPVVRGQQVVGVISRADLLRALPRALGRAEAAAKHDPSMTDERLIELERQYWLQRTRSPK